jgi:hypothetical protein
MHRYKRGKAKSGPSGRGGKVKSRKQAIAIALSKARKKRQEGAKKESVGTMMRRNQIAHSNELSMAELDPGRFPSLIFRPDIAAFHY